MKNNTITIEDIGCCGTFCDKCKVKEKNQCIGCKIGYKTGERVLAKGIWN